MKKKIALFAFNSDPAVFAHVLANALDMKERGYDVRVVVEGDATKYISLLRNETKLYADLWHRALGSGLVVCACRTCVRRNTAEPAAIEQNIILCDEMEGHPSIAGYLEDGYEVIVF
jgi:intracellular sulfur oxidation DsrE/DsrF family protein